jgi:hypothetical protein
MRSEVQRERPRTPADPPGSSFAPWAYWSRAYGPAVTADECDALGWTLAWLEGVTIFAVVVDAGAGSTYPKSQVSTAPNAAPRMMPGSAFNPRFQARGGGGVGGGIACLICRTS